MPTSYEFVVRVLNRVHFRVFLDVTVPFQPNQMSLDGFSVDPKRLCHLGLCVPELGIKRGCPNRKPKQCSLVRFECLGLLLGEFQILGILQSSQTHVDRRAVLSHAGTAICTAPPSPGASLPVNPQSWRAFPLTDRPAKPTLTTLSIHEVVVRFHPRSVASCGSGYFLLTCR